MFQKPDTNLTNALRAACGAENVITDAETLKPLGRDYTEDLQYEPALAVLPATAEEVAAVLKLCNDARIPVYARGAGTGLSAGSLPVYPGVVLVTSRLNRVLNLDMENFQATVEPGVINQVFRDQVEALGLYYPPDPASRGSCFLGGNIAHGSGGPRAVKYGTTRDYVLNLQVALPTGELIWTGANTVKNSTGFNLTQLMVGSEGLLGVVTKIVFRLVSKPQYDLLMLASFSGAGEAAKAVNEILLTGIVPSALELMESRGVELSANATQTPFPFQEGAAYYLLIELDGNDQEQLYRDAETLFPALEKCRVMDVLQADTADQKAKWWKVRRSIGETVKSASIYKEEDTVVPRAALPALLTGVKEIGNRYGFESVCYGHAGDGNLHVNILKNQMTDEQWNVELPRGIREIFELCRELGGTISGEHGIGLVQKQYLDVVFDPIHFQLMRGIKQVFDPNGILNPGKWLEA
ncbi:MAG: FAD-binding protein [Bacteroidetes bacterium]|nr:FAD-binding protein [Bacteroidota bacterium]